MHTLGFSFGETMKELGGKGYTSIINTNVNSTGFFLKQIIGGMFITIGMTGLDQEMMQKNISVKNLKDSQKNVITFSFVLVLVNFLFLLLGGLLYLFASHNNIATKGDDLFPTVALQYLPSFISIIFIIALISALFPSADGALTALTSSFCIDILGLKRRDDLAENQKKKTRLTVHLIFACIFFLCVMMFKWINNKSIIGIILTVAGYTYGPLLALFAFGIFTRRKLHEGYPVLLVCLAAPALCYLLSSYAATWFNGFQIGIELLLINAIITFIGLWFISKPKELVEVKKRVEITT
jgi:Na+/proline symporter